MSTMNHQYWHNLCGQMLIMGFDGLTIEAQHPLRKAILNNNLGGVILFDKNLKKPDQLKNIQHIDQVKQLTTTLQNLSEAREQQEHGLPLWICVDYEGGNVNRLKSLYGYPETITPEAFAALSDEKAAAEAKKMAHTLKQAGFNLNFSPLIDVNINPENPIIAQLQRSFSDNPLMVEKYATIIAKSLHDENITFCYKHFPGHGSSRGDSHLGIVDVSETWRPEELIPYQNLLKKAFGCDMIMSAHIINRQLDPTGLPASLSHTILTGLLRQQYHYDGLIIADDLQMNAITDAFGLEESIVMAINAGNDLLIVGNQCGDRDYSIEEMLELMVKNIVDGYIPEARIHESFGRIKRLKARYSHVHPADVV